jgi:signal transduction histidine kinase
MIAAPRAERVPANVAPPPAGRGISGAAARLVHRAARAPLLTKLLLASAVIDVSAFVVLNYTVEQYDTEVWVVTLLVTHLVNGALAYAALLPLGTLQAAASRVAEGDLDARARLPGIADRDIAAVADTLNRLLDGVTADRARMRALAAQVISAGDQERARIARELHDSTAQQLSALDLIITAMRRDGKDAESLGQRLDVMQQIVGEALGDVRTLSQNVHPRVLDELGLPAALEWLARRTRETSGAEVRVTSDVRTALPAPIASTLYRVAQEAVSNAVRHGAPRTVRLAVAADGGLVSLEVEDDGRGFDVAEAMARRGGMGLFTMRERVGLVDGRLEIVSRPGGGTRVHAAVPSR